MMGVFHCIIQVVICSACYFNPMRTLHYTIRKEDFHSMNFQNSISIYECISEDNNFDAILAVTNEVLH